MPSSHATETDRSPELGSDKAQRIVDAMRKSIGVRGPVGSTFDNVARDAGVSRGLLHYYFGSKERLMIEVIRQETDQRIAVIEAALGPVKSAAEVTDLLLSQLKEIVAHEPGVFTLGFELIGEARRTPEIGAELAEYQRRTRARVAEILQNKAGEGIIKLRGTALGTASLLLALGNGLAMELLADPESDHNATIAVANEAGRLLLGD